VKLCQTPGSEDELKSAFDQLVSVLLHDLITLAVPVFEKVCDFCSILFCVKFEFDYSVGGTLQVYA